MTQVFSNDNPFKAIYSFEQRKKICLQVRKDTQVYPIIALYHPSIISSNCPYLKLTIASPFQLMKLTNHLRQKFQIDKTKSIYLTNGKKVLHQFDDIKQIYLENVDPDGFLYLTIHNQSFSGSKL